MYTFKFFLSHRAFLTTFLVELHRHRPAKGLHRLHDERAALSGGEIGANGSDAAFAVRSTGRMRRWVMVSCLGVGV